MRLGTLLLFLVLIIMGFGFLLSNNIFLGQDLQAAQQQIAELTQGKTLAENQLDELRNAFANLKQQYELLAQEKRALESQTQQIQAQYVLVQQQNAQMQVQIERMNKLNVLITHLTSVSPNALMLAVIVPLLPITLAGSVLIYRKGKSGHQPSRRKAGPTHQKFSINVTKEELKLIREMRRNGSGTSN